MYICLGRGYVDLGSNRLILLELYSLLLEALWTIVIDVIKLMMLHLLLHLEGDVFHLINKLRHLIG